MVRELQRVTGIVEVGLFVDSVEEVYFGMEVSDFAPVLLLSLAVRES